MSPFGINDIFRAAMDRRNDDPVRQMEIFQRLVEDLHVMRSNDLHDLSLSLDKLGGKNLL